MNILGYHRSANHILSFELTIDGEDIGKVIMTNNTATPYRLFLTGLALPPLDRLSIMTDDRIIAVCSCGQYGCGCTRCKIVRSWDNSIVFRDFIMNPKESTPVFNLLLFCFSQTNYDDVVTGIFKEIQESEIVQQVEKLIAENVNG
jgi:hypothetical protein